MDSQKQLELLKEDVQAVCMLGEGLTNAPDRTIHFFEFVQEEKTILIATFNRAACQMKRSELKFDIIQAINDPSSFRPFDVHY